MAAWENRGRMARVRLYDQAQDGLEYVTKCLSAVTPTRLPSSRRGLSHLTLSDGFGMLRARPVMGRGVLHNEIRRQSAPPPHKETLLAAGQWPVVTFQAVPGSAGGFSPPAEPQLLKTSLYMNDHQCG